MKKVLLSLIISLVINLAGGLINYIYYRFNRHLLLCFRYFGGEITVESGFGVVFRHIYAMSMEGKDSLSIYFEPLLFAVWVLAIALIIFLILMLAGKFRKK